MCHERQIGLSEEENDEKREYSINIFDNISQESKQKLKDYNTNRIHGMSQGKLKQLI